MDELRLFFRFSSFPILAIMLKRSKQEGKKVLREKATAEPPPLDDSPNHARITHIDAGWSSW